MRQSATPTGKRATRRRATRLLGLALVLLTLALTLAAGASAFASSAEADGYQFAGKWGTSGTGDSQFDGIGGIAIDGSGTVYVSDTGNKRIEKFSASGAFLAQWGTLGAAPGGVAVDSSSNVYVTDYWSGRILKFSSSGASLAQFDTKIAGDWESSPYSIAVDSAGTIWITDSGDHLVKKFSSSGGYLGNLGSAGSEPGQFEFPVAVAIDPLDNVYVVDCFKYNVQKFSSGGTYLDGRVTTWSGDANLLRPGRVAVDGAGNTYVADSFLGTLFNDGSVKKFDSSFVFQTKIGVYAGSAPLDGTFCSVWGVAIGPSGNVYIADGAVDRVTVFAPAAVIPAPSIAKLSPASGKRGAAVTISGAAFGARRGAGSVKFGAAKCATPLSWSDTKIKCKVPAKAKFGKLSVTVTTAAGKSKAKSFTVKR